MENTIDPAMLPIITQRMHRNSFANYVGIRITACRQGYAVGEVDLRQEILNPLGIVHGGCLYTLADTTAGMAAATYGYACLTLSSDFHFLSPGSQTAKVIAEATLVHRGKTVLVFSVKITSDGGRELAAGTFSFFNTGKPLACTVD
jgi:acyl-CoA thioesterase